MSKYNPEDQNLDASAYYCPVVAHDNVHERLGWFAVTPSSRSGPASHLDVYLTAGDIVADPVVVREDPYMRHGDVRSVIETVYGIDQATAVMLSVSQDGHISGSNKKQPTIHPDTVGRFIIEDKPTGGSFQDGSWQVGNATILKGLRDQINYRAVTPDQARRAYIGMYIRFNQRLVSRHRAAAAPSVSKAKPIEHIVMVDPELTEPISDELSLAVLYAKHLITRLRDNELLLNMLAVGPSRRQCSDLAYSSYRTRQSTAEREEAIQKQSIDSYDPLYKLTSGPPQAQSKLSVGHLNGLSFDPLRKLLLTGEVAVAQNAILQQHLVPKIQVLKAI
jgi:hypothetical protein